jgi:hypothetical protein
MRLARHDQDWEPARQVHEADVLRNSAARERSAFVRFLAGGKGWQQASRELSGAFAEPPARSLTGGPKE